MRAGGDDIHRREHIAGCCVSFFAIDEEATNEFLNRGHNNIALNRLGEEQPFGEAIFRHISNAAGDAFLHGFGMNGLAINPHSASKIWFHAEERQRKFRAA